MKTLVKTTLLFLVCAIQLFAQSDAEYKLKSAFIERFTRFISWPDSAPLPDTVLLGIVGDGSSFPAIKSFFNDVKIQNKEVAVRNIFATDTLSHFSILFIQDEETLPLATIRQKVTSSSPTLLICDNPKKANEGAMIIFNKVDGKLKFSINPTECEKAGFKVSSFLLKMATIVTTDEEFIHEKK